MTVGTRIDNTVGTVTSNTAVGITVERNAANKGFAPYPADSVLTVTTSVTLDASSCGLTVLSGTAGALTLVMPSAAVTAGATFIFRSTSADAHILTGSQEAQGVKVFDFATGSMGASPAAISGSRVTFPAIPGATLIMVSTGQSFMVTRVSGVMSIS